jgi:hypothetical protein
MQKMYTKKYKKPQKIEDKCTPKIFIKKTQKQMFKKNAPGIKHPHIMCITLGNPWWMDPMSAHSWVQFPEWVRIPIFPGPGSDDDRPFIVLTETKFIFFGWWFFLMTEATMSTVRTFGSSRCA